MTDLPRWPSKGNRRRLEALWLERLELQEVPDTLVKAPVEAPHELYRAVHEFNNRLFWECHETLEDIWRETRYPLRFFYHAIIKVAVGLHHASRHNRHGAQTKLSDGVRLLRLFQPHFLGIRTGQLLGDASVWLERVSRGRSVDWAELDALPTPVIRTLERPDADRAGEP